MIQSPVRTKASGPPAAASGATCRTTVPYAVPLIRASQMRTMSRTPCSRSFFGQRHVRHLGHARVARGPHPRSTSTESASTSRSGSSMRACRSSMLSKTTARPRCCSRCGDAAAGLMMAPRGARLPRSTAMPAAGISGASRGSDDVGVPDPRVVEVVDERPPGHGDRLGIEQVLHLAQHGEQAAGAVQVVHEEPAGRLEVDEERHARADARRSRRG